MNSYFKNIINDYKSSEITSLLLFDVKKKTYFNILTLIELVPFEQEKSSLCGPKEVNFLDRISVNNDYKIFIARAIEKTVLEGITIFENSHEGFDLKYENILHAPITIFPDTTLENEPNGEYPLLIDRKKDETIAEILPNRETTFRVWTKIDREKKFLTEITPKIKGKIFEKASTLTVKHLGFDFSSQQIHFGNIYLFACNPYLRKINFSLPDLENTLLMTFYERRGKSASGCKMVLQDKRGDNFTFYMEDKISSKNMKFSLPETPHKLHFSLFDHHNYPLEISYHSWSNIQFSIGIQESILELELHDGSKMRFPKNTNAGENYLGAFNHSKANYFKEGFEERKLKLLGDQLEFMFFPGSNEDKTKAREFIAKIIAKSKKRCYLLDAYFSENAIFYAYATTSLKVSIRILGAAFYLKKKKDVDNPESPKHAELLLDKLNELRRKVPLQSLECKVLKGGDTSKLHDRYIVSDDSVYLLGSSFHEFGGRATTIIKVPVATDMIEKADEWWNDEHSTDLEQFVEHLKNTSDDTKEN